MAMKHMTPKTKKPKLWPRSVATLKAHQRRMRAVVEAAHLRCNPVRSRVAQVVEITLLFAMGYRSIDLCEEVEAFTDLILKEAVR